MQGEHSNQSSFFGMIYEELIPADHLLCKLAAAVELSFVSETVSDSGVASRDLDVNVECISRYTEHAGTCQESTWLVSHWVNTCNRRQNASSRTKAARATTRRAVTCQLRNQERIDK